MILPAIRTPSLWAGYEILFAAATVGPMDCLVAGGGGDELG
jgi:hypothetical protein